MSHPLPATRYRRRVKRMALRLVELLETLELPDRKAPLPVAIAGRARRTLSEAEALLRGGLSPPAGSRSPGELFASALLNLKLVSDYKDLSDKANSG